MSETRGQIKTEYNNLVKNVEKLKMDVNSLDNFISKMNNPEIQYPIPIIETQPQQQSIDAEIPQTEIQEEKKEELLEVLTDPNEKETKSNEQLLADQKEEMNDRKTNIENALIKMAQNIKNNDINQNKTQAWDMLKKTNKELEHYLSTTLFYDIKRDWATYSQQLWYRPEHYLNMFLQSYNDLNLLLGRNQYFKDIMRKHLNKETLPTDDLQFISIKNQIDDAFNGIKKMQQNQKGGRKTRKYKKQKKIRTQRKQRKSRRKQ